MSRFIARVNAWASWFMLWRRETALNFRRHPQAIHTFIFVFLILMHILLFSLVVTAFFVAWYTCYHSAQAMLELTWTPRMLQTILPTLQTWCICAGLVQSLGECKWRSWSVLWHIIKTNTFRRWSIFDLWPMIVLGAIVVQCHLFTLLCTGLLNKGLDPMWHLVEVLPIPCTECLCSICEQSTHRRQDIDINPDHRANHIKQGLPPEYRPLPAQMAMITPVLHSATVMMQQPTELFTNLPWAVMWRPWIMAWELRRGHSIKILDYWKRVTPCVLFPARHC